MRIQFVSLIFIFVACCKSDEPIIPDPYWGTASVLFNGEIKDFKPYCISSDTTTNIYLDGFDQNNLLRYEIVFGLIKEQEYRIDSLTPFNSIGINEMEYSFLGSFIDGGDVLGNIYKLIESDDNYLEITDWNADKKEIKGIFHANFIIDGEIRDPNSPDTIRLVNGKFYSHI